MNSVQYMAFRNDLFNIISWFEHNKRAGKIINYRIRINYGKTVPVSCSVFFDTCYCAGEAKYGFGLCLIK